jgi:hypothetical protein
VSIAFPFVLACAVCGAADKALPANGSEIPFEGRKRATLELRAAAFETSSRALQVAELRAVPGVATALGTSMLLSAEVPLLERSLVLRQPAAPPTASVLPARATASPTTRTAMLGDAELRLTSTPWRSAPSAVARRLTISAGMKLPTAPLERDPSGALVHPDLQPGCSSVVPVIAVTYGWTAALWSAWTGASLLFPVAVREGAHSGDSLRASFTMQLQPARVLATRLGVHGRLDGTGELEGEVVRRSGGASVHVAPEIVLSPVSDVVLSVGAAFPVVQEMRGYRATTPVLLASAGVDF